MFLHLSFLKNKTPKYFYLIKKGIKRFFCVYYLKKKTKLDISTELKKK